MIQSIDLQPVKIDELSSVVLSHTSENPHGGVLICADARFQQLPELPETAKYVFSAGSGLAAVHYAESTNGDLSLDEQAEILAEMYKRSGVTLVTGHMECAMARYRFGKSTQGDESGMAVIQEAARRAAIDAIFLASCCLDRNVQSSQILTLSRPITSINSLPTGYRVTEAGIFVRDPAAVDHEIGILTSVIASHGNIAKVREY
jgi:hypothetical protein